ncbi:AI-2E family transporter [Kitasatospora sp. NPDC052896]|uniref:AI-2E family transporter n=1 Tax=Kitasatospora sp. NPDC052896 TaxID=3364061 RepID=UPI0037C98FF0
MDDRDQGRSRPGRERARQPTVLGSRPPRTRTTATAHPSRGPARAAPSTVGPALRRTAGYAWRLLVVGVAGYAAYLVVQRLELLAIALFLALVVTSVLRPAADLLGRALPRPLAVLFALLGALVLLGGLFALVGEVVASESGRLGREFGGGLGRIEQWLEGPPFRVRAGALTGLQGKIASYLSAHRSTLISTAVSGASRVVEFATVGALALFCSIFFIHSGDRMWRWAEDQLPTAARSTWDRVGRVAWRTFAGYTRGIVIVAASNAALVGVALALLRVPLALPLTLLEFFATLVPLVGSPIALAVAAVVALATRGPVVALIVLALIVVIGQIEGHVLHPLVMGWAVRIHPVAVALSVAGGAVLEGVLGAVVAVPVVSVAWAVVCELRGPPGRRHRGPPAGR